MNDMNASEKESKAVPRVAAAVIVHEGRVLIAKRKTGDPFEGRWEFPGGKIDPGESPEQALRRELREELGVETEIGMFLCAFPVRQPDLRIDLLAFRTRILSGDIRCHDHDEIRWIDPEDLRRFDLTDPDRLVVETLFPVPAARREAGETRRR